MARRVKRADKINGEVAGRGASDGRPTIEVALVQIRLSELCQELTARCLALQDTLAMAEVFESGKLDPQDVRRLQDLDHITQTIRALGEVQTVLGAACQGQRIALSAITDAAHLEFIRGFILGDGRRAGTSTEETTIF